MAEDSFVRCRSCTGGGAVGFPAAEAGSDLEPVLFQVVVSISFDDLNFSDQVDNASEGRATELSKFHRGCKKYLSISPLCTV